MPESVYIVQEQSPLDYHGVRPQRLSLMLPGLEEPKSPIPYFQPTTRGGKTTPGATPGTVAFIDYSVYADGTVFIHYMNTRMDQRSKKYARALVEYLYDQHKDAPMFDWGEIMHEGAFKLFQSMQKTRTVRSKGKFW